MKAYLSLVFYLMGTVTFGWFLFLFIYSKLHRLPLAIYEPKPFYWWAEVGLLASFITLGSYLIWSELRHRDVED